MDSKTQPTSSTPMSIDAETFLRSLECSAYGSHSRETGEHDWEAEAEADAAAAAAEESEPLGFCELTNTLGSEQRGVECAERTCQSGKPISDSLQSPADWRTGIITRPFQAIQRQKGAGRRGIVAQGSKWESTCAAVGKEEKSGKWIGALRGWTALGDRGRCDTHPPQENTYRPSSRTVLLVPTTRRKLSCCGVAVSKVLIRRGKSFNAQPEYCT